uniref:Ig-like domain-containing protein n=1 Tax=Romanomermis culicivorax TaxID=13658 RepID=A0A915JZH7_ROMCU
MYRQFSAMTLYAMYALCFGEPNQPPEFVHSKNPTVIYVVRSQTTEITINCEARGHPTVKYRWLKNNRDLERQGHPSTIHTTGPLSLSILGDDQAGLYQCVAYNDYGSAYDQPVKVELARTIFYHITSLLEQSFGYLVAKLSSSVRGTLFFQRVSEQDIVPEFYYTCIAENSVLKDYKFGRQFTFSIRERNIPMVEPCIQYSSPNIIRVIKGADVNLYCLYTGRDLAILWKKNGAPMLDGQLAHEVRSNGKVMRLKNVQAFDEGVYSCTFPDAPLLNQQFNVTIDELRQTDNYEIIGSKLKILNAKLENVAVYQCNASNIHGEEEGRVGGQKQLVLAFLIEEESSMHAFQEGGLWNDADSESHLSSYKPYKYKLQTFFMNDFTILQLTIKINSRTKYSLSRATGSDKKTNNYKTKINNH